MREPIALYNEGFLLYKFGAYELQHMVLRVTMPI
jgi:hypothetical protein